MNERMPATGLRSCYIYMCLRNSVRYKRLLVLPLGLCYKVCTCVSGWSHASMHCRVIPCTDKSRSRTSGAVRNGLIYHLLINFLVNLIYKLCETVASGLRGLGHILGQYIIYAWSGQCGFDPVSDHGRFGTVAVRYICVWYHLCYYLAWLMRFVSFH